VIPHTIEHTYDTNPPRRRPSAPVGGGERRWRGGEARPERPAAAPHTRTASATAQPTPAGRVAARHTRTASATGPPRRRVAPRPPPTAPSPVDDAADRAEVATLAPPDRRAREPARGELCEHIIRLEVPGDLGADPLPGGQRACEPERGELPPPVAD